MAAFDRRALSAQRQVRRTIDSPHEVHSSSPGHGMGERQQPRPTMPCLIRRAVSGCSGEARARSERRTLHTGGSAEHSRVRPLRAAGVPSDRIACGRAGGRARSVLGRLRVLTAHTARAPAVPREYRVSTVGGAVVKITNRLIAAAVVALQRLQSFTAAAAFIALKRLSSNSYRLCGFKSKYSRSL
jgi:hypothetical protein